jgi:hypothetical protein
MTGRIFFPVELFLFVSTWSCQLPPRQVLLLNTETTTAASFGMSCDNRQTWKPITLAPKERQRYDCDSPKADVWMRVNTDLPGESHKESELQLQRGQRYEIYFDVAMHKWDVRPTTSGGTADR